MLCIYRVCQREVSIDMVSLPPIHLVFRQTTFKSVLWMCFCCQGPLLKRHLDFSLTTWLKREWIKHERQSMNEWKSCHSVLSIIPVNPTFFVLLPFAAHIPQPGPIWNTKVWPLLHLTHSHTHCRLLLWHIYSSRSFAEKCKDVNEYWFCPCLDG